MRKEKEYLAPISKEKHERLLKDAKTMDDIKRIKTLSVGDYVRISYINTKDGRAESKRTAKGIVLENYPFFINVLVRGIMGDFVYSVNKVNLHTGIETIEKIDDIEMQADQSTLAYADQPTLAEA